MTARRDNLTPSSNEPPHPRLSRYCEFKLLGRGGMGDVWRAWDPVLEQYVALKLLRNWPRADDERLFHQLFEEARVAIRIQLEHVVRIYDVDPEVPCIRMEYVPGCSLWDWVRNQASEPLHPVMALWLFCPVADTVHKLHLEGVTHRDIKPANLLLQLDHDTPTGAKLCDFGLSRGRSFSPQAIAGAALEGSYDFAPPERIGSAVTVPAAETGHEEQFQIDAFGDQYSLAASLFFAVTGQSYRLAPRLMDELPGSWREVLNRALHDEFWHRFPSVAELTQQLRTLLDGLVAQYHAAAWQAWNAESIEDASDLLDELPEPLRDLDLNRQIQQRFQSDIQVSMEELYPRLKILLDQGEYDAALPIVDELLKHARCCEGMDGVVESLSKLRDELSGEL